MQVNGNCWLCGAYGALTREHIPPKSVYNSERVQLEKVSEEDQHRGRLVWVAGDEHRGGYSLFSLCVRCNNRAGRSFAPAYKQLCNRIAEKLPSTPLLGQITLSGITNPQLVIRQVLFQFVTANGAEFVDANPWVRETLLTRKLHPLPSEVHVYLFAVKSPTLKNTGVSGRLVAGSPDVQVFSEFTFWPLGTVLSWGALPHPELTAIRDWAARPFASNEKADLTLTVNPCSSPSPVDFRLRSQCLYAQFVTEASPVDVGLIPELERRIQLYSGKTEGYVFAGHPAQGDAQRDGHDHP
jgi:hypothetical protein